MAFKYNAKALKIPKGMKLSMLQEDDFVEEPEQKPKQRTTTVSSPNNDKSNINTPPTTPTKSNSNDSFEEADRLAQAILSYNTQTQQFYRKYLNAVCTNNSCPVMQAGPKYTYYWSDDKNPKPVSVSAPKYVQLITANITESIPAQGATLQTVRDQGTKLCRRLFRVYVHMYYTHFVELDKLGQKDKLNTLFLDFYKFLLKTQLMDASEAKPVAELIDNLLKQESSPSTSTNVNDNSKSSSTSTTSTSSTIKVLVEYETVKKTYEHDASKVTTVQQLVDTIKLLFEAPQDNKFFFLEYFDPQFDDYTMLEDLTSINDKTKMRLRDVPIKKNEGTSSIGRKSSFSNRPAIWRKLSSPNLFSSPESPSQSNSNNSTPQGSPSSTPQKSISQRSYSSSALPRNHRFANQQQ